MSYSVAHTESYYNVAMVDGEPEEEESNWILSDGTWNDSGVWIDTELWIY